VNQTTQNFGISDMEQSSAHRIFSLDFRYSLLLPFELQGLLECDWGRNRGQILHFSPRVKIMVGRWGKMSGSCFSARPI